jgi:hypothetical protein
MRLVPLAILSGIFMFLSMGAGPLSTGDAFAQATCRNKCNAQEQACLKRTNNKGQCGSKAKSCSAKCK